MRHGDTGACRVNRACAGEVMRKANGKYLYFNGECWTTKYVTPTDTPF
jgi:hypothetical protein